MANFRNPRTRRDMREAIKAFNKALEVGKSTEASKLQRAAVSAIDIAAKKNVIHKNKAARFKSRLASQAKASGVKPSKASPKSKVESGKSKTAVKPTANPDVRKAKSGPRPKRRGKAPAKKPAAKTPKP